MSGSRLLRGLPVSSGGRLRPGASNGGAEGGEPAGTAALRSRFVPRFCCRAVCVCVCVCVCRGGVPCPGEPSGAAPSHAVLRFGRSAVSSPRLSSAVSFRAASPVLRSRCTQLTSLCPPGYPRYSLTRWQGTDVSGTALGWHPTAPTAARPAGLVAMKHHGVSARAAGAQLERRHCCWCGSRRRRAFPGGFGATAVLVLLWWPESGGGGLAFLG